MLVTFGYLELVLAETVQDYVKDYFDLLWKGQLAQTPTVLVTLGHLEPVSAWTVFIIHLLWKGFLLQLPSLLVNLGHL